MYVNATFQLSCPLLLAVSTSLPCILGEAAIQTCVPGSLIHAPLGILPVTGRHAGSLWVEVLPDLSHPGPTLSCPGSPCSPSPLTLPVSFFPGQLPIFKLFQSKLGQSVSSPPESQILQELPLLFFDEEAGSLHFHKQVLKEGI